MRQGSLLSGLGLSGAAYPGTMSPVHAAVPGYSLEVSAVRGSSAIRLGIPMHTRVALPKQL
eukprot:2332317-Rhodomonas_salina.3